MTWWEAIVCGGVVVAWTLMMARAQADMLARWRDPAGWERRRLVRRRARRLAGRAWKGSKNYQQPC